jgi:hypothetical protein
MLSVLLVRSVRSVRSVQFGAYATGLLLALFFLLNRVLMLPGSFIFIFEDLNITIKTYISTTMERGI